MEGFGPVARGFAGAGVAHATGAAAMMLNPAELMSNPLGHELMGQNSEIHVNLDIRNRDTHESVCNSHLGDNRGPYDLPELAYSYRAESWAFGTGIFAAAGFGSEFRDRSFLSRTSTGNVDTGLPANTRLIALKIPFALAWQPHPRLKVGAALDVVRLGANLANLFDIQQVRMLQAQNRVSGGLSALAALPNVAGIHMDFVQDSPVQSKLQAWGVGGRIGASWQLSESTILAAAYDAPTRIGDLKGNGQLTAVDLLGNQIPLQGRGRIQDFQLPASAVVGISHRLSPSISVVADLRRTLWKHMLDDVDFDFQAEGGLFDGQQLKVSLPLGFNHLTTISAGLAWAPNDTWTLRMGASRALQELVKPDRFNPGFATVSGNHLVANASYRWRDAHEFTAGATYAWADPVKNPGNNTGSIPAIRGSNVQITPMLSYRRQF